MAQRPGRRRTTKAARIRTLLAQGHTSTEVARIVGVQTRHVCVLRWNDRNPGYKAQWQADYRERERAKAEGASA